MDMFMVAAFVAFFAMVAAWLVAPASGQRPAVVAVEPVPVGAD